MKIREFLYTCRHAAHEIRAIERQREAIRLPDGPQGVRTANIARVGTDNNPTWTALNQLDYYDGLLTAKKAELAEKLTRLEGILDGIADGQERGILRYYFVLGYTDWQIGDEMGLEADTVGRRRREAIRALEGKGREGERRDTETKRDAGTGTARGTDEIRKTDGKRRTDGPQTRHLVGNHENPVSHGNRGNHGDTTPPARHWCGTAEAARAEREARREQENGKGKQD